MLKRLAKELTIPAEKKQSIIDRLLKHSELLLCGCRLWTGAKECYNEANNWYGCIKVSGKKQWVHRVAYAVYVGTIPNGITINHKCKNTLCINPEHLELVTHAENLAIRNKDRKDVCPF